MNARLCFFSRLIFCVLSICALPLVAQEDKLYWEDPWALSTERAAFVKVAYSHDVVAVVWQEVTPKNATSGEIRLSASFYDGSTWHTVRTFSPPLLYNHRSPSLASVAVNRKNEIFVAAAFDAHTITVFKTTDFGKSFTHTVLRSQGSDIVAPYVSVASDDSLLLFASHGSEDHFSILLCRSEDGERWTPFQEFLSTEFSRRLFLPSHVSTQAQEIVVFQAHHQEGERASYQLYSTVSFDQGNTWSAPVPVTQPDEYHNQRPFLDRLSDDRFAVTWERSERTSTRYEMCYAELDRYGRKIGTTLRLAEPSDRLITPNFVHIDGTTFCVWAGESAGLNTIFLAQKKEGAWSTTAVRSSEDALLFPHAVRVDNHLEVFWQEGEGARARVMRLRPDQSVQPPTLIAENFSPNAVRKGTRARVRIVFPRDSSGIAGYNYAWQCGVQPAAPPDYVAHFPDKPQIELEATQDGTWFLAVTVWDFAGNKSAPAYLSYTRDTTPAARPQLQTPLLENTHALKSNTFTLSWNQPSTDAQGNEERDHTSFLWSLQQVAPLSALTSLRVDTDVRTFEEFQQRCVRAFPIPVDVHGTRSRQSSVSFTNKENGIYRFSVYALDRSGNVSEPAVVFFALRHFVPYTAIRYVDVKKDPAGSLQMSIVGNGFRAQGTVSQVYIDRDRKAPYDLVLHAQEFAVGSDNLISDIHIDNLKKGSYHVGVWHPARGVHFAESRVTVSEMGTVKFGAYDYEHQVRWSIPHTGGLRVNFVSLFMLIALFLAGVVFAASLTRIGDIVGEAFVLKKQVEALMIGELMPSEKRRKAMALKTHGAGLRVKFILFALTLVISVIFIVSVPLGVRFSKTQKDLLAKNLFSRVQVLLESLVAAGKVYLPAKNKLELGFLPNQTTALHEARYAVITGESEEPHEEGIDFVWATNFSDIETVLNEPEYRQGNSRFVDKRIAQILPAMEDLNRQVKKDAEKIAKGIADLTQEAVALALRTDQGSVRRRDDIQSITRQMDQRLLEIFSTFSNNAVGSYPEYRVDNLSKRHSSYLFYKPILYRQRGHADSFVHGVVFVEVSTQELLEHIEGLQRDLIKMVFYVSLIALACGVFGAWILASIIIKPIRRLASHVAMIRDTEKKEELEGKLIAIKGQDEIALLGRTINDMTEGLIKAALASKDLTVGKEIQKMFIPLDTNTEGRKLTSGYTCDDHVEFFGYYEGALGVSGDYFDYIKLDDQHYAIIKCDVAGKGVPAALIMVEVATLFQNFFKDWNIQSHGINLSDIVSRINDLIEARGFKGRFAAFTLCIFNTVSGTVHFCNAGDNIIHIYDAQQRKMKRITLAQTSAAGVFPSFMIDMKGGFGVETLTLRTGDVLFLYTDGIEEAKRLFRNKRFELVLCQEQGLAHDAPHETHTVGQAGEELGAERVSSIIESVFLRKGFSLQKWHNPVEGEKFEFDFSSCEGNLDEADRKSVV